MFYQIMMFEFANFGVIKFKDKLPLQELCKLGLEYPEAGWNPDLGSKTQLSTEATSLLVSKADMLRDYFALDIDQNGFLSTIPMLLVNYIPDLGGLPIFVLRLATAVNWTDEQLCFQTLCRQTAKYYSKLSPSLKNIVSSIDDWQWTVEHVVYPTLKSSFLPPKKLSEDKTIMQIASLPDLYKVFERC